MDRAVAVEGAVNVGQLKRLIANMPDDAPILRPAPDHAFARATAHDGSAGYNAADREYTEWWGAENAVEGACEVRALIVR